MCFRTTCLIFFFEKFLVRRFFNIFHNSAARWTETWSFQIRTFRINHMLNVFLSKNVLLYTVERFRSQQVTFTICWRCYHVWWISFEIIHGDSASHPYLLMVLRGRLSLLLLFVVQFWEPVKFGWIRKLGYGCVSLIQTEWLLSDSSQSHWKLFCDI